MADTLETKLDRLTRLVGTDAGFYVLALHAFVEYYLRYEKGYGEGPRFPELTWSLRNELLDDRGDDYIPGLSCLGCLGRQHGLTNQVRHAFEALDPEEARAATHLFMRFCGLVDLERMPQIRELARHLDAWQERASPIEQTGIIDQLQTEILRLQGKNSDLLEQRHEYGRLRSELEDLQASLDRADRAIHEARGVAERRKDRMNQLRKERNELVLERTRLLGELEEYAELGRYLRYLGRLSIYTRTRLDYERSITELTPEQQEAVSSVTLKGVFLIRGGPGTGKSLVLIEALRRAVEERELDFGQGERVVLITFTRTLVKFDRYVSRVMGLRVPLELISTVDTLFYDTLSAVSPGFRYDFALAEQWFTPKRTPPFLSVAELRSEVEDYLFAAAVSREEYLEQIVEREGMRRRLSRNQREQVWRVREEFAEHMEHSGAYTKDYGRLKLLRHLDQHPEDVRIHSISHIFVDEVQDLTPAALMILRRLTRSGMIMAGDTDQSLYNWISPFSRAGLSLRGTTRVLKTNFRSTRQIADLAQRFRSQSDPAEWDDLSPPLTFRQGPEPELYRGAEGGALRSLLAAKADVYVEELGYEAENLCVLVPRNREVAPVVQALELEGLRAVDITHEDFDFALDGSIRVSTLHSSKGLDFPVVLLYLPYLPRRPRYDEEQTHRLMRNLVYVGMSRAMDGLNAFVVEDQAPPDKVLAELVASFR